MRRIFAYPNIFTTRKNEKYYQFFNKMGGVKPCFAVLLTASLPLTAQAQLPALQVVAPTTGAALAPAAAGRLYYAGQAPGTGVTPAYFGNLSLCPNPIDPTTGTVSGQPYIFEFRSQCRGNVYNGSRQSYSYTLKYATVGGREYQETWVDREQFPASEKSVVRFFMFDRVPSYNGPTGISALNSAASTSSGNTWFSPLPTGVTQTAAPGEVIKSLRIEGSGYNCGFFGGDDTGNVDIDYYTLAPRPIAASPQAAVYCRNTAYALSTPGAFGASGYQWTATNGAQIINGTGFNNQVTLNLNNVPPTATDVTVSVRATNAPGTCGGPTSTATTLVLPMSAAAAQPRNMALSGGNCPSTVEKNLTVTPQTLGLVPAKYRWKLVGAFPAGTVLINSADVETAATGNDQVANIRLRTPIAGAVTVSAEAIFDGCGGLSEPLVQTFQISNPTPAQPTGNNGPKFWCSDAANRIRIGGDPNLFYTPLNVFGTFAQGILPAGARVTAVTQPVPGGLDFLVTLAPNASGFYPTRFDLQVTVESPCPGGSAGRMNYLVPMTTRNVGSCQVLVPVGNRLAPLVDLFPNPTTGEVRIVGHNGERYEWAKVNDAQGRTLLQAAGNAGGSVTHLDLKALPVGLYQVQLFDGKQLTSQRLVKE